MKQIVLLVCSAPKIWEALKSPLNCVLVCIQCE